MSVPGMCLLIIDERNKADGEGTLEKPQRFAGQDFTKLHEQCLQTQQQFTDSEFPPSSSSIGDGLLDPEYMDKVEWKRPKDILTEKNIEDQPYLIEKGISRFDFGQGILGDCWFLSAVGALTFYDNLLKQVLPSDQGFQNDYAGIFHFRFWRFGMWVDVVIDDMLPTIDGDFIFVHPKPLSVNKFWASLLEKAYAKVCGSYGDMKLGDSSEAMIDFTGGVQMLFLLDDAPPDLWDFMHRAVKFKSLLGCGTRAEGDGDNVTLPNGLVEGHAYTITGVQQVTLNNGNTEKLVRVWNPWGEQEWNGDWSDHSPIWQTVTSADIKQCLKNDDTDGEFWMSMTDFTKYFHHVDVCCLSLDVIDDNPSQWGYSCLEGRWVIGTTAGGNVDSEDTFWTNPQYHLKIKNGGLQGAKNMLLALMQINDKKYRHLARDYEISFYIFVLPPELQNPSGKLPASFFTSNSPVVQMKQFLDLREISDNFYLAPGDYILIPCTADPYEAASFVIRIFSKSEASVTEITDQDNLTFSNATPEVDIFLSGSVEDKYAKFNRYSNRVRYPDGPLSNSDKDKMFKKYCDKYMEVNAEQLQRLLNDNVAKGGFGLDTCRSIVAMMDGSVTGKLSMLEFQCLWKQIQSFRNAFIKADVSSAGQLPLCDLQNAIKSLGPTLSSQILNTMALRYGNSSGSFNVASFIFVMLRLDWMNKIFCNLSNGKGMNLQKNEWLQIVLYS